VRVAGPSIDAARARSSRSFLLGLAVATGLAAIDVALGSGTAIIGTLVVAPLVTAFGATARLTALVWAYALGVALLLGAVDGAFGSGDHVTRVLTVLAGGALVVVIAYLRRSRELDASRLEVQYAVARILSEANSLEEAAPRLLQTIGDRLGWEVAGLWELREPGVLRCVTTWSASGVEAPEFHRVSREFVFRPGMGLPGRVLETNAPAWVPDVRDDDNFPRAPAAAAAGLRAAVGFPVRTARGPGAVIEFFARTIAEPDEELLRFMEALGNQVGEFLDALRAREAVAASEARKSAVVESALDGVITIDHTGKVVEFNAAAEETFGYTEEEAVGREMAALVVPPAYRERHRAGLRRVVETGESTILGQRIELTAMGVDGNEFPVELAITRIGGEEPPMFTGYVRDITDRKRAEEERERLLQLEQVARLGAVQARDQLEAILSGVADGVTAQAPDGRLIYANEAAVETLGYGSVDELLEAPVRDVLERFEILDEEGAPFPLERLPGRVALAERTTSEALIRFRVRRTGEERWSQVKAAPVLDEDGEVLMAINVMEDITEHKRSELREQFLSESTRVLQASLDLDETLEQVARLAVPDMADWCVVDLAGTGGSIERVALVHTDPARVAQAEQLQERYPPDPRSETGVPQVLRTGRPELYPEVPDELLEQGAVDEEHLRLLREFGLRSAMIVPMISRGRALGALTFVSGPSGRHFDAHDLALAEELARRCADAVQNARVFAERSNIAQTLQRSLLPAELPSIPGFETAARFEASGEGNEVGGDFYDLFQTRERGWTVVVGDVCGKGPDAAAVTALARYTLRAAAMREQLPSRILRLLNEALLRQRDDRRFCTVAYAYLEAGNDGARVGIANGGHPLPLVLRADGSVEWLGTHGTLLGVVEDPDLEDTAASLSGGDALVFYTDGVTEARGDGGHLDERRLVELLSSCAGMDAQAIATCVTSAAIEVQGGRLRDDIAVVVLRALDEQLVPAEGVQE
jgi:PAS domain S-box-containing protein